jgi:hypothetical protein
MPRKKADDLPPVERVYVEIDAAGVARRVLTPPNEPPREVDALGQPRLTVLCTCGQVAAWLMGGGIAPHEGHVAFDPGPPHNVSSKCRSPQAEATLDAYIASFRKPAKTDPPAASASDASLEPDPTPALPAPAKAQPPPPPKRPSIRSTADQPEPELGDGQDPYVGA